MQKKINLLIILIATFVFIGVAMFYDAIKLAPKRYTVRYETIISEEIPEQLNDVSILFFSDVHFNKYMDINQFKDVVKLINNTSSDVVVFLGDLIAQETTTLDNELNEQFKNLLKEIQAPLGKFAIFGENDLNSFSKKETVSDLLKKSGFELINNKVIQIRNQGSQSINFVGLDSMVSGSNYSEVINHIPPSGFTISMSHEPDSFLKLPQELIDIHISGHSLGGQIYVPFIGGLRRYDGATTYYRGKYNIDSTKLFVTHGLSTIEDDVRFLTNADVIVINLKTK
ncbi:MAG: metallophosphoesterase [Anaerorhabdus sp.]